MATAEVTPPATANAPTGSLPAGPPLPRWLQTVGFLFAHRTFVGACHRRYGPVISFSTLFDPQWVMVSDPDLLKELFRASTDQLRAGEANATLEPVVGTHSVLLADGAEHMRQRKLLLPPFHGERMRAYADVIRDATDRQIESWPVGEPFALLGSMQSLTLDVILRAVFGTEPGPREDQLKAGLRSMLDPVSHRLGILMLALSGGRLGASAGQRFEARRRAVDELIYAEIARRRAEPDLAEREDILSMLLLTRDEAGEALTDPELRDELITLLVAGHETTATALSWAFELVLRHPPVLGRLRTELAAGDPTYLNAVIREILRIRPVISAIGRKVRERPFALGPYLIPPGTEINPSIAGIHRRADRYPEPARFRPERFLGDDAPDTYAWLPFGGGPRRCLGAAFATFEMAGVIGRVLERVELAPSGRRPEKGARRGITFVPARGARVVMESAAAAAHP